MLFSNESVTPLLNITTLKGLDLEKYNLLKYRMICAILDTFALYQSIGYIPTKTNIRKMLIVNKVITESKEGRGMANAVFAEMCMMGLIIEDGENIVKTPLAIKAYKENTYHQICASLTSAHESHKVGVRTLWVSALALIVALVSLFVTIYSNSLFG